MKILMLLLPLSFLVLALLRGVDSASAPSLVVDNVIALFRGADSATTPAPVLDTVDKEVQAGVEYYIWPVIRGMGGGVTLASTGNETCPLGVVQERHELEIGLPVIFTPVIPKEGVVRVSTDLNIKFSASTICVQSTLWKLNYDASGGQYFVSTGGVEGNPSCETFNNWFKIEAYKGFYKLVFCPRVCEYAKVSCRDVGIFFQNGMRRLALTSFFGHDEPFLVRFIKKA